MAGLRCHVCLKEYPTLDRALDLYDHVTDTEYSFDTIDCLIKHAQSVRAQETIAERERKGYAPIITNSPLYRKDDY